MPIDLITANPDENNPATIATEIDLFVRQLKASIPQINAVIAAFNFNATNSTSTTSLAIGYGTKNLNVGAGKSYDKGMAIACAYSTDPSKWMRGEVLSYDSGTGDLSFDSRYISSVTGTYATWVINQAAIEASVTDSRCVLTGNGGHGVINTKLRLLTTTTLNTGTAFSISHSSTLATSITANDPGIYVFSADDSRGGGLVATGGFVKNTATPTTSISSTSSDCIGGVARNSAGDSINQTVVVRLAAGDIINWKDAGVNDGTPNIFGQKIGNV